MDATFLVVDKPEGVTSHDVVACLRAVTGEKKVGHTGTLDPFATGVLALAFGGATRLLQYLDEDLKVYDATIRLGRATDTGDPTGETIREAPVPALDRARVEDVLRGFLGERLQRPPAYSAVKHKGRPLYWYARRGEVVEVEARPIRVDEARLVSVEGDVLRVIFTCGKGTYARVLAEEVAEALGTVGHLEALARLRSGPFFLEDALSLGELARIVAPGTDVDWREVLLARGRERTVPWRPRTEVREAIAPWLRAPLQVLSHLPILDVDAAGADRVRNGAPPKGIPGGVAPGGRFVVAQGDRVLAIAEASLQGPKVLRVVPGA